MKAMKPPPIAATPAKPIVGRMADTAKANPFVGDAIAVEMLKSKSDPKTMPMTAIPHAMIKGILMFFI